MPRADRMHGDKERDNHHRSAPKPGQRPQLLYSAAGNRAIQRLITTRRSGSVIQRRLSPPSLGRFLNRAVQTLMGTNTEYTRYVLQATDPTREGGTTFVDVQGPLHGWTE